MRLASRGRSTPEHCRVEVEVGSPGVWVRDTGCGLQCASLEDAAATLGHFFRSGGRTEDAATAGKFGLGLKLVLLHVGTLHWRCAGVRPRKLRRRLYLQYNSIRHLC